MSRLVAKSRRQVKKATKRKKAKLSRLHKPPDLALEQWQIELRRQFGSEQALQLRNLGKNRVFSEFAVTNPESRQTYRVVIRGEQPGVNYCSCPDYAVNTLGTCKHIEFTLHRLRKRNAAALRKGYAPPFAEVYVRYGVRRSVVFSPGTDCTEALRKLAGRYFGADGTLKPAAFMSFDAFLRKAKGLKHDLRIYDDTMSLIAGVRDGLKRRQRLEKRYNGRNKAKSWKSLLKVPLFPYQQEGTLFAATAGRAIIADEMGLGKTIQAIAAAEMLARDCGVERVLIICPASLKHQWALEIERFSSRPSMVIEGLAHQRKELYTDDGPFFKIVNYDVVHRDLEHIASWQADLVVLDEAQRIKNWQTRAAKTVKQVESPYAMVLTGTPLENRLDELHSIVEFVDRHRLGPLFAFKDAHEIREENSPRVIGYRDLNKVTKTLGPILIRRTKKEVLKQLPPRMDKNFFVPMTDPQWDPHRENQEIVARLVHKWRRYKFLSEQDQLRLRIALQYMRMACDSTYLIDHETKHGTKVNELEKLLSEVFEDSAAKVVIFSQWVRMNELVAEMLEENRWGHVHLHGGVPSRARKELIRALREEPDCRVFLSTDAGGVGLNLQRASTVINMDVPWNPAVLEQRTGRVHRLGQREPVRVVNFISEGTIEHGMLSLLSFKRSVFAGVLDGTEDRVFMGDSALERFVKTVETATSSVPRVSPTPAEPDSAEERKADRPTEPAPRDTDLQPLGELLSRGADLLQALGQSLAQSHKPRAGGRRDPAGALIERDPATGRAELRIPLPAEEVLQRGIAQLSGFLSALLPPR